MASIGEEKREIQIEPIPIQVPVVTPVTAPSEPAPAKEPVPV